MGVESATDARSIIHPHDRPYVADQIDRALEVGAPYALQYRVMHADGSLRWISERGRAIRRCTTR
jgi:PAS domain-containing protein